MPDPARSAPRPSDASDPTDPAPARPPGPVPAESGSNEAPDRDTPAWEGAEPEDAVGLVDPRPEIPNPPGL